MRISLAALCLCTLVPIGETNAQEAIHLDLDEAIALAVSKNYSVKASSFGVQIAKKNIAIEQGAFDPTLGVSIGKSDDDILSIGRDELDAHYETTEAAVFIEGRSPWGTHYRLETSSGTQEDDAGLRSNDSTATLSVTQPLLRSFGFDSNLAATRIAKSRYAIARWSFANTLMSTVEQVTLAYSDYYFAVKNLEVSILNRDLANKLLEDNRRRVEVGRDAESDITLAEARYALRAERVHIAERLLRFQSNRLKGLIFDDIQNLAALKLIVTPIDSPDGLQANAIDDFESALASRPDYQQALLGINSLQFEQARNKNRVLPKLDLVGRLQHKGSGTGFASGLDSLGRPRGESTFAGIEFSIPLPNRSNRAQAAQTLLQIDQASVDLEQLKQAIYLDLDTAAFTVESSWQRIDAARQARRVVQRSLEAEEKKLKAGRSSSFFVLDLQEDLANATIREIAATTDFVKSKAIYERESGVILERNGIAIDSLFPKN